MQIASTEDFEGMDPALITYLYDTYGPRLPNVISSLTSVGKKYYFRVNTLLSEAEKIVEEMRANAIDASRHETVEEAGFVRTREQIVEAKGTQVVAGRFAAEAVLQGAHLYAPGVKYCHGLRYGCESYVTDTDSHVVGSGKALQGETSILTHRSGVAVEVRKNMSGLPSLMETEWYQNGRIYLQTLPAIVTSLVLAPKPDHIVVDMNCSPGGKLSHVCQLTRNKARVVGFDRNQRKLERTRGRLERLGCSNFQLLPHDSRYVHLDYTMKADRVLVDPPCTGLGVAPKLSIGATGEDVKNLSDYQKQFLTAASRIVKSGGKVVYSVCTMTRPECEEVVKHATDDLGLVLEEAIPMIGRCGDDPEGLTQRFDPDIHGSGYFIAKFRKP